MTSAYAVIDVEGSAGDPDPVQVFHRMTQIDPACDSPPEDILQHGIDSLGGGVVDHVPRQHGQRPAHQPCERSPGSAMRRQPASPPGAAGLRNDDPALAN